MPGIDGVLETALYVDDLERSRDFYARLFGFEQIATDPGRLIAMRVAGKQVLLLFKKKASLSHTTPHDGDGHLHVAFAIPAAELPAWEARLAEFGIAVEDKTTWDRGGISLYFRDPDRHLLELATPGVWTIY